MGLVSLISLFSLILPFHLAMDNGNLLDLGDYGIHYGPKAVVQAHKLWRQFVQTVLNYALNRKYSSFLHIFYNTQRSVHTLYNQCFSQSVGEIRKFSPCGHFVFITAEKRMEYVWYFETIYVTSNFNFNITIHNSYVDYSDDCKRSSIKVVNGFTIKNNMHVSTYCGHIVSETMYTRYNKAHMLLLTGTYYATTIKAVYQAHIQGLAFSLSGINASLLDLTINVTGIPYSVYKVGGHLDYIWYYTHAIRYGMNLQDVPKSSPLRRPALYANVTVHAFQCRGRHTFLHITHGLLPYSWLPQVEGQHLFCNLTSNYSVDVSGHRFFSILLQVALDEIPLILFINAGQASDFMETGNSFGSTENTRYNAYHKRHITGFTMQTYTPGYGKTLTLTVKHFKYRGAMSNILPYLVNTVQEGNEKQDSLLLQSQGKNTFELMIFMHFVSLA